MVNCYIYINVFPAPKLLMFFLYKIYGVCLSKRGKYRNVKAENLNAMCTFSSHMDHVFVLINGIFRLISYAVNFIVKACGPPRQWVNLRRVITHNKMDAELEIH